MRKLPLAKCIILNWMKQTRRGENSGSGRTRRHRRDASSCALSPPKFWAICTTAGRLALVRSQRAPGAKLQVGQRAAQPSPPTHLAEALLRVSAALQRLKELLMFITRASRCRRAQPSLLRVCLSTNTSGPVKSPLSSTRFPF